jgi:hypothetical protein
MREIEFPKPKGETPAKESAPGSIPPDGDLFLLRKPKHRYFCVTGNAEHAGPVCARLEDEGFDILSVSSFIMVHGQAQVQYSQITARIVRSALPTQFELEVEEASKRMVRPIHGNLPPVKG